MLGILSLRPSPVKVTTHIPAPISFKTGTQKYAVILTATKRRNGFVVMKPEFKKILIIPFGNTVTLRYSK